MFEKFKKNSLTFFWLCPSHYLSAPSLNWDAMSRMTKIRLVLIQDPNMHIFFEKEIRDGISYISNRYSRAEDYHDLYLKCDVLLLTNVFEKFRKNSLKIFWLCPSHYLSAPGLSWHAMARMTKIRFVLIPDPDMHIFFEKKIRDGISYISNRYSRANNKYLKSHDP